MRQNLVSSSQYPSFLHLWYASKVHFPISQNVGRRDVCHFQTCPLKSPALFPTFSPLLPAGCLRRAQSRSLRPWKMVVPHDESD